MLRTCGFYLLICAFAAAVPAPSPSHLSAAEVEEAAVRATAPADVATLFFSAFADKDIDTVLSLFAPGALVQRARLESEGPHDLAQFGAAEWAESARAGIAGIRNFHIEILEIVPVEFGSGVTVSVRFRATGQVGENVSFTNDGVDSLSMIPVDGTWRILLYNSMEKLEIG